MGHEIDVLTNLWEQLFKQAVLTSFVGTNAVPTYLSEQTTIYNSACR